MIDTRTGDLLAAITDALTPPPATTCTDLMRRSALIRHRAQAVRDAVAHAHATGDLDAAVAMIDAAMREHPVTYMPGPPPIGVAVV